MMQKGVNCLLVALHDIEHAIRRPDSFSHSARISEAEGSRSEGFSTKVFPQASATGNMGNIHIGTMTGKLNGVMPATTPSG
jgi:hypothetical protein